MDYTDITIPCHICTSDAALTYLTLVHQSVTDFTDEDRADWYELTTVRLPVYTPAPPVVVCRHCGQPMQAKWQKPIVPGKHGFWLITCERFCDLEGFTFSKDRYQEVDLQEYTR